MQWHLVLYRQSNPRGRTVGEDIYLVGVDALSEALEDVLAGTMTGTVFNDHFSQSHSAKQTQISTTYQVLETSTTLVVTT